MDEKEAESLRRWLLKQKPGISRQHLLKSYLKAFSRDHLLTSQLVGAFRSFISSYEEKRSLPALTSRQSHSSKPETSAIEGTNTSFCCSSLQPTIAYTNFKGPLECKYCVQLDLDLIRIDPLSCPFVEGVLKNIRTLTTKPFWFRRLRQVLGERGCSQRKLVAVVDYVFESTLSSGVLGIKESSENLPCSLWRTDQQIILLKALLHHLNNSPMPTRELENMGLETQTRAYLPSSIRLIPMDDPKETNSQYGRLVLGYPSLF